PADHSGKLPAPAAADRALGFQRGRPRRTTRGPTPRMRTLNAAIALVDRFTEALGRAAAWLTGLLVQATCSVVTARYAFNSGSAATQESLTYINALFFMLCAAYTLRHDGHVRVDIFYAKASPRIRAWIDLLGTAFLLLPVCVFLIIVSWDYVAAAW